MSSETSFRKFKELVDALVNAEKGLTAGTLRLEELEAACNDARALYERLVVLRHKARESAVGHHPAQAPTASMAQTTAAVPMVEEPVVTPPALQEVVAPVRLDTRPAPDVSPRQTSLIEAIENTEQEQAPEAARSSSSPSTTTKGGNKPPPSVAEKLEKAAVGDLHKAITLSHKFWFVAELFNGDRINYEKAIEQLNGFGNLADAKAFLQTEVIAKLKKPADPEALSTFTDLVQRRYA